VLPSTLMPRAARRTATREAGDAWATPRFACRQGRQQRSGGEKPTTPGARRYRFEGLSQTHQVGQNCSSASLPEHAEAGVDHPGEPVKQSYSVNVAASHVNARVGGLDTAGEASEMGIEQGQADS